MKRNQIQTRWGWALGLAFLAAIPFIASAQTEMNQARTNVSSGQKTETKDSADSEEITLTIEGMIHGGRFLFQGNTIEFSHARYSYPRNITINGKALENDRFTLDYIPDFSKVVILEKEGGEQRCIYALLEEKSFSLMVYSPPKPEKKYVPFRVKLAVKNQTHHDNLPPDEFPWPERKPENVANAHAARNSAEQEAKVPAGSKETTLSIDGKIYGGIFIFEGNTIRFSNMMVYRPPEDVTIDGKPWQDITKPFELDYTPDFARAGILEQSDKRVFYLDAAQKQFSLRIANHNTRNTLVPFHVKLAVKDQLPHDDLPGYQPVSTKKDPPKVMTTGPDPYVAQAAAQWNDGMNDRKIEIKAVIRGRGAFVFEGNTIQYRREDGDYPDSVKINGRRWSRLDTKAFELPFQIENSHPEIEKKEGENPVKLTKNDDRRFEVVFDDSEPPSRTHSPVYTVTVFTSGK